MLALPGAKSMPKNGAEALTRNPSDGVIACVRFGCL